MQASRKSDTHNESEGDYFSLSSLILLTGTAIGVFLMLRGIGQPWNGLGGGDGALYSSMARNYIQFGVNALHQSASWLLLFASPSIISPVGRRIFFNLRRY
jgi:hypothetical protein